MSRKVSREQVFKILFAIDIGNNTVEEAMEIVPIKSMEKDQQRFILDEIDGVLRHKSSIDQIIDKYSSDWNVERLPAPDRTILRLSLFEIMFRKDIPVSVSINEAVEMAKKFCDHQSYKFINGLLGSAVKEINR